MFDRCVIGRNLEEIPEQYRAALESLVSTRWIDGGLSDDELSLVLAEAELPGSPSAISRHRRGLCVCGKARARERIPVEA